MKVPESLPIFIGDLECVAFFDYQPAEPEVNAGEQITVTAIEFDGMDVTGLLGQRNINAVEDELLADLHQHMTDYHEAKGDWLRDWRQDA